MPYKESQDRKIPKWLSILIVLVIIPTLYFSPFILGLAGEILIIQEKYQAAVDLADVAVRLRSDYAFPYSVRAKAFSERGELEKALQEYTRAIDLNPREWVYYTERGNVFSRMGKSEDAIADYTKSIEIHPTNEDAYINRGREFALAGDYENAKEDFSKAIEINPDSADAYLDRGIMYSLSEKRKAQSDFQKAIELFREEGDFEKAELALQMLEDLDP